jgi:hypothetical protein
MENVDRVFFGVPIKKTTQGRPNECQILYLGITIKLIDRSQRDLNEFRITILKKLAFKVNFRYYLIGVKGHSQRYMQLLSHSLTTIVQ